MRQTAPFLWAILACALPGCATMKGGKDRHPGNVQPNPAAVVRTYPASATRVSWALTQVMKKDPILDDVKLMVDPQSNESRPLSHGEREALGMSALKVAARDLNYNITAKSKDGHRVGAVVQIKGDSDSEVTLLYGTAGDPELSRALLDEVQTALAGPVKDPGLTRASASKPKRPPVEQR